MPDRRSGRKLRVYGGGGPAQPVIHRLAKPAVRNRCDTDNGGACGVGCMHHLEQIRSGLMEVAFGAQIETEFACPAGLAKPDQFLSLIHI